jgi:hypothetical protein
VKVRKRLAVTIVAGLAVVGIGAGATGAISRKTEPMTNRAPLTTKKAPMAKAPAQPPKLPSTTTTFAPKPR